LQRKPPNRKLNLTDPQWCVVVEVVSDDKGTKPTKATKGKKDVLVKKAFFLYASQFRALKIFAAERDLGVSEALRAILEKAGVKQDG
jgi:hypothetical protein